MRKATAFIVAAAGAAALRASTGGVLFAAQLALRFARKSVRSVSAF